MIRGRYRVVEGRATKSAEWEILVRKFVSLGNAQTENNKHNCVDKNGHFIVVLWVCNKSKIYKTHGVVTN